MHHLLLNLFGRIDIGADVRVLEERGNTLLFMAARGDCAEIIERLCRMGCDPNAVDDYEDTTLMDCCSRSNPETIRALIQAGAKVNVQNQHLFDRATDKKESTTR